MLINDNPNPSKLLGAAAMPGVNLVSGVGKSAAPKAFAQALSQVRQSDGGRADPVVKVKSGDTLIGLIKNQAAAQGVVVKPGQEMRLAHQVAQENRIQNPNWIFPGQQISFNSLDLQGQASPQAMVSSVAPAVPAVAVVASVAQVPLSDKNNHPVLEKTLERAVSKGFIPALEKNAVYDKILQLANTHNFKPDDFARMTLMESDGMNPRASNQRCHGIIQFCDGPARGAASAGYAANPRAILDLSVHKQLGLVEKYFEDVGLKNKGPAGLEDLYLSVLNPASRNEKEQTAPLKISGQQSSYLYEKRDTGAQMTRQSIRQGLLKNAAERLGQMLTPPPRLQAMRASKYSDTIQN
jgi:hypothetical protein